MNSSAVRILIVDDEPEIYRAIGPILLFEGYEVFVAETAKNGLDLLIEHQPHIVILDLSLPDIDGKVVIQMVREWSDVPIIVLSADHLVSEKVSVLDLGANDYVEKPFSVGELLARLRVALRWRQYGRRYVPIFKSSTIVIDYSARRVTVRGAEVHLTPKEFKLLQTLADRADQVVTLNQLLEAAWRSQDARDTQTLRVTIKNLRQKIEANYREPEIILTEPGVGYRLCSGNAIE